MGTGKRSGEWEWSKGVRELRDRYGNNDMSWDMSWDMSEMRWEPSQDRNDCTRRRG